MDKSSFEYNFVNATKIVVGKMAIDQLAFELKQRRARKPLIVTEKRAADAGLIKKLVDAGMGGSGDLLGVVYDGVNGEVSTNLVKEIVESYRAKGCDALFALGRETSIDAAKGAALAISKNTLDVMDAVQLPSSGNGLPPFFAAPTTIQAGARLAQPVFINGAGKKTGAKIDARRAMPHIAFLDHRLMMPMEPLDIAASGMAALSRAMETCISLKGNPISETFAHAAIKMIAEGLVKAVTNAADKKLRMTVVNAALLSSIGASYGAGGVVQAVSNALGSVCGRPVGNAAAIILPHAMKVNAEAAAQATGKLLLPLAGTDEFAATAAHLRPERAVDEVKKILITLNRVAALPIRLRDFGVGREKFGAVAQQALADEAIEASPVKMDVEKVMNILEDAYA